MKDAIGWRDRLDIWHPLTLIPHWQIGSNPSSDFLTVTSTRNLFVLDLDSNLLMRGGKMSTCAMDRISRKSYFRAFLILPQSTIDCSCPHVCNSPLLKLEIAWWTVSDPVIFIVEEHENELFNQIQ